jgi:hypothetical protein
MLDLSRLERVRERGRKVIARCPACAELGADRSGDHLSIFDGGCGPFACVAFAGPGGGDHRRRILELAGVRAGRHGTFRQVHPKVTRRLPEERVFKLPPLLPPTIGELAAIAQVRGWHSFAGLELLRRRGLLWMGTVWDAGTHHRAWFITDSARRHAQARRLDGRVWDGIGGKARSVAGSTGAWPIGASEIGDRPWVVLCEGQPDFAAALLVAWWEGVPVDDIAPVCMAGTGASLHPDSLALFAGKNVLIPQHNDESGGGAAAAANWARQLYKAGAVCVDGYDFNGITLGNGRPCKDLADYATLLKDAQLDDSASLSSRDWSSPPAAGIWKGILWKEKNAI